MALSPGGCTLATGGGYKDKTVRLWRPQRRRLGAEEEGGEDWRCVAVLKVRVGGGLGWERPVPPAPGRTCRCACGVGAASLKLKAREKAVYLRGRA